MPVILKPTSQTPLSAIALAECPEVAGIPGGVFQLAIGKASMIADQFLNNPVCRKISFTGSTQVGQELIRGAANSVKPLSLELGGLAPVILTTATSMEGGLPAVIPLEFNLSWHYFSCVFNPQRLRTVFLRIRYEK